MGLTKPALLRNANDTVFFPVANWEDLRFPATGINPPGPTGSPTRDETDATLIFSKSATNMIAGIAQMPHSWKLGTAIECHIHWEIPADTNGVVVWLFEYASADLMGVFPETYTPITVPITVDAYGVRQHIISSLTQFIPGVNISNVFKWKLSRMGAATADTYDNTAKLLEFDVHYQIDALGSGEEHKK